MAIREFFDDVQMAAESGGRQFGPDGKPLVGRYRDGSMPSPSKRAYGAGQMQVGTARNVATSHGVPWDENKFYSDREYNLDLANRHMKDLQTKYGDKTIARAAYHSGEPIVDKAITKYGRSGFAQGLGPEGRNYIKMGTPAKRGQTATPRILDQLTGSLGTPNTPAETKSSGNVRANSDYTFGSDAELDRRADVVEGNLVEQGGLIGVLNDVTQAAQAMQVGALSQKLQETQAVSNEIVEGTTELRKKVMPVFQARQRIADQMDKLATMNPLERGIRGIFDLNYDRDYLEGQLDQYDRTLQARASDYDYLNKLHGMALQEVERRFSMTTAMPELLTKQATEDLGIVGMEIQQSSNMLGSLNDRIGVESRLIVAKAQAREDLLLRLDSPTITDLMTQAQESDGIVNYNGVEFSYGELRDRALAGEQQELQEESYRMSIAGNRMDLAEKYATNIAQSLTRTQLEAAIQNGGVYNGITLPQDVLTNLYASSISRDQLRADTVANNMPAAVATKVGANSLRQSIGLWTRGKEMLGPAAMEGSNSYMAQGSSLVTQLTKAIRDDAPPEVITKLTQQIAANSASLDGFVQERILRSVGGDKRAAGYMQGFVYEQELSQGTAAEAMTYFALKGNLPAGMQLTPESRQVFAKAQKLVEFHRTNPQTRKPRSEAELQALVTKDLVAQAPRIMGQARHEKLYSELPGIAKQTGHPFGKFDSGRWAEIRAESQATAAESIARELNTTPQNVLQMLRNGRAITADESGNQLLAATKKAAGKYNAVEMQTTVRLIDSEPAIQSGRRNSSIMSDYLGSPQFATGVTTYGKSFGAQSIGEYLVNPMVEGATERNFLETRQTLLDSQAAIQQSDRQLAQNPATNMLLKPVARTQTILGAIPGVGSQGAKALAPFAQEVFKDYVGKRRESGRSDGTFNQQFRAEDAAFIGALRAQKFEDPMLESYRKQAIKGWEAHSTAHQGFLEQMINTIRDASSRNLPNLGDAEF